MAAAQGAPLAITSSAVAAPTHIAGHIGHLSPSENSALNDFRTYCADRGFYKPAVDGGKPSHDDETLLRFLRARRFNVQDAFGQFSDTEAWRKENHMVSLYENINVDEYEETRRLYPQWTGRRDKRGLPVYLYVVSHLNSKLMGAHSKATAAHANHDSKTPARMLPLFALYENMIEFVLPLCTAIPRPNPETPISQSNNIVDISGVGLKQFWNLRSHMQDASTLATAHYPETLDRIFIIGAPSFFPTVWGWIKRWFDPITTSKIFILGPSEVKPTLTRFIDPENVPRKYGGELDFEFGMLPNLDPVLDEIMTFNSNGSKSSKPTLPRGPVEWQEGKNGDRVAVAVGSINGTPRREPIATLHPLVKENGNVENRKQENKSIENGNYVNGGLAEVVPPYQNGSTQATPQQTGLPQDSVSQVDAPQPSVPQTMPPQIIPPQAGAPQAALQQAMPLQGGIHQIGQPETGAPQATHAALPQASQPQINSSQSIMTEKPPFPVHSDPLS